MGSSLSPHAIEKNRYGELEVVLAEANSDGFQGLWVVWRVNGGAARSGKWETGSSVDGMIASVTV